jgi:assimilatory nitrate reductase catalytic subunit
MNAVRTTCPYCGVGCGVLARAEGERLLVAGDPAHPANAGRLCVKGAALGETVGLEGRLLHPTIDGRRADWETALAKVAQAFSTTIARHGPDSVAFYVSGQFLTEDYYVANKLMKGFIGSANIDTNSRLCMSSSVAGHVRAFGSDTVPGCYEDLELADLVVLVGSNAAWCHPILFRRIEAAKAARRRMRVVVIDPRRTATAEAADLHLAIRPGSDVALFNGLLLHLVTAGAIDQGFVAVHTEGFTAALAAAGGTDAAAACDVPAADLATFYRWFADTDRVVTLYSQGVNQSSSGTDKVNAIINCHLLTGRIGRPGMGPLSLTGQPNAMGGREVGGLANQLAAHMTFEPAAIERVRRFWKAPAMATRPGLKAVELFNAVHKGQVKALWIMATNPAVSLPDASLVKNAIERCDFVAVSDCMERTDTTLAADVLLPALAWAEKDGTVTNSERRISRQRAVLPPPGEARADWWMLCQVAKRMGFAEAFSFATPAEIFAEHARLSEFDNDGRRDFDIGPLAALDYDRLEPVQWPVDRLGQGTARLFADGRFFHPDGKARFVATAAKPPAGSVSAAFPLALNTGRIRDQWHTMTRTGKSPRLSSHIPDPFVAVLPDDCRRFGLTAGGLAELSSRRGTALLRVAEDDAQRPGELFAPIHWNDQFATRAVVGRLIAPAIDPISGQPEFKFTPVAIRAVAVMWEAVLACRGPLTLDEPAVVWSRAAGAEHTLYRLAGTLPMTDWRDWVRGRLGEGNWLDYEDRRLGLYRAALLRDQRLEAVLFVSPAGERPSVEAVAGLFARQAIEAGERVRLLASGAAGPEADAGPVVCACHGVRRQTILEAGLTSVEEVGRVLKAGTGCGSCLPELRALLAAPLSEGAISR